MVGPAPDVVREQAPGLHRTAVMLTGDADQAGRLLGEAISRAVRVWGASPGPPRERVLEELVRAYLRRAPPDSRGDLLPSAELAGGDAADVLVALGPRQRVATVLVLAEGVPPDRVATMLHVRPSRAAHLVPATGGLADALESLADHHERSPEQSVRDVRAALADLTRPDTARAPETRPSRRSLLARPWTVRLLAAAVALGVVAWVSALSETPPAPDPVDTGAVLTLVDGTVLPTTRADLAARGWVLDADGRPPTELEGLRLVESVRVDLTPAGATVDLDTRPSSGTAVFAVLWCDLPVLDANLDPPVATLHLSGEHVTVPCAGAEGEPPVSALEPLPPGPERLGRVPVRLTWTGDVPEGGTALLATYTEVSDVPDPAASAAPVVPVVGDDSVVLDATSTRALGRRLPVHARRVRIGHDSTVTAWAGGTGYLVVQVDDVVLTDDGEPPPVSGEARHTCESVVESAWRSADPELRAGRWLVHQPGRARTFSLPESVRPPPGTERVVSLFVAGTVPGRQWQVQVAHAAPVAQDRRPLPLVDPGSAAPEWVGGHRLAAAWEVPSDGLPHTVVDPGLRPGRRFVAVPAGAAGEAPWDVVAPHVVTTRGPADLTVVPHAADAFDASIWRPGDQLVRGGASTRDVHLGTGTRVLSVAVPPAPESSGPTTVLVYEPVPYEDYVFSEAPPMAASTRVGTEPAEPARVAVGRWTRDDLDEDGRIVLDTDLSSSSWLRLTTQGRGRVRVLEGGEPAVWLPDGWWTSWTAQPVVTELRIASTLGFDTPATPVELVVEGYEEGFVVEVVRDHRGGDHVGGPETLDG